MIAVERERFERRSVGREQQLPRSWSLFPNEPRHCVVDVEKLVRGAVTELRRGHGMHLQPDDVEDLVASGFLAVHLLLVGDPHSTCSRCGYRLLGEPPAGCPSCGLHVWRRPRPPFDPDGPLAFRPHAYVVVRRYLIDELRRTRGRHGQKALPSLDALEQAARDAGLDDATGGDRGLEPNAQGPGDEGDRSDARAWIDPDGGRGGVRTAGVLGRLEDGDHPRGAHRPGDCEPGRVAGEPRPEARGGARSLWVDCAGCGHRSFLQAPNGTPDWHFELKCTGCGAALLEVNR